jgi:FlaA1/EpsC-like NDP-sugar epimerase
MKISLRRFLKIAVTLLGFSLCYFAAVFSSALLVKVSLVDNLGVFLVSCGANILLVFVLLFVTRLYSSSYSHAGILELLKVIIIGVAVFLLNGVFVIADESVTLEWDIVCALVFMALTLSAICFYRLLGILRNRSQREKCGTEKRVLVVGAGVAGATIISELAVELKIPA